MGVLFFTPQPAATRHQVMAFGKAQPKAAAAHSRLPLPTSRPALILTFAHFIFLSE